MCLKSQAQLAAWVSVLRDLSCWSLVQDSNTATIFKTHLCHFQTREFDKTHGNLWWFPFTWKNPKNSPTAQSPGSLKNWRSPTQPAPCRSEKNSWDVRPLGAVLARIFDTWQDTFGATQIRDVFDLQSYKARVEPVRNTKKKHRVLESCSCREIGCICVHTWYTEYLHFQVSGKFSVTTWLAAIFFGLWELLMGSSSQYIRKQDDGSLQDSDF